MPEQYKRENDQLVENFFASTFGRRWLGQSDNGNMTKLELEITSTCNLACRYCYMHHYGNKLYPKEIKNRQTILNNLRMVIDWLISNDYRPDIDIFSGDPLTQEIGLEALEIILDKYRAVASEKRVKFISIPTNFTFLLDDNLTKRIEHMLTGFSELGMVVSLSASFDGKYMETNRPLALKAGYKQLMDESCLPPMNEDPRDDQYYEKCFSFAKKHQSGFHPMVYSRNIEHWKDNFIWFQQMMAKHDIPFQAIYLLEVRNEEWSLEQTQHLHDFVRWLINYTFETKCDRNPERYLQFARQGGGFNILTSPFVKVGRGIGCSFQGMVYLRLGDLAWIPCHRTSYSGMEYAKMRVQDNRITGWEARNVEFLIQGYAFEADTFPVCDTCLLKNSCSHGCIGAQFESTGDFFSPIPTVCRLEHAKVMGILRGLNDIGLLWRSLAGTDQETEYGLKKLIEYSGL